jgi:hypothetical protein
VTEKTFSLSLCRTLLASWKKRGISETTLHATTRANDRPSNFIKEICGTEFRGFQAKFTQGISRVQVYLLIKKSTAQYDLNPLSFLQRPLS